MQCNGGENMIQDIEYNGIKGSSLRIYAKELLSIPAAQTRWEKINIPGKDGSLFKTDGCHEPTEIKVPLNYIGRMEVWGEYWRAAKKWLSARNTKLRLSDDNEFFYRISHVVLDQMERKSARTGNFVATFVTVDGMQYLVDGIQEHDLRDVLWNPYELCHPVYKIMGDGVCTLTVNENKITANVGQNLIIDTERMISYREDGILQNTAITGDYEGLFIKPGKNSIDFSGGELKIIPNWRCL